MGGKDLHKEPFDDSTKAKLEIFKLYIKEWLPVFVANPKRIYPVINIFDFFAGPGMDSEGVSGTPLIIIDCIKEYIEHIEKNNVNVNIVLNEYSQKKYKALNETIIDFEFVHPSCNIKTENSDFQVLFEKCIGMMNQSNAANLVFLDQNGIKQITPEVFTKLIRIPTTDIMFFISSSHVRRFNEHPYFQKHMHFPNINEVPFYHVHRKVLEVYKSLIPEGIKYHLGSFSLKKGGNIYGLIFGSRHHLGMEKFLRVCWKIDPINGEANYDIDDDNISLKAPSLFEEDNKPTKKKLFEKYLLENIENNKLKTNHDLYYFTLEYGLLMKDTKDIIKRAINDRVIIKQNIKISSDAIKEPAQIIIKE